MSTGPRCRARQDRYREEHYVAPSSATPLGEHETTLSASAASSDAKHGPLPSSKVAASCSANLIYLAFIAARPINSFIGWPVGGGIDAWSALGAVTVCAR